MTFSPPAETGAGMSLKSRQSHSHREGGTRLTGNDAILPAGGPDGQTRRFSSHTHAVEFSRIGAGKGGQRKGLRSRQRPPVRRATKRSYPIRAEGAPGRLQGLSLPPFRAAGGV